MSWQVDERDVTCRITVLNITGGAAAFLADGCRESATKSD